jgi:hypothetical protein
MPNPPRLEDCEFFNQMGQSTRFRTVDLRGATGLTFFFAFEKVYAIHAHTLSMPYAKSTFDRLPRIVVSWIYLPIPRGEEIVALGLRLGRRDGRLLTQRVCFLVTAPSTAYVTAVAAND